MEIWWAWRDIFLLLMLGSLIILSLIDFYQRKKTARQLLEAYETGARRRGWSFTIADKDQWIFRGTSEGATWTMKVRRQENFYD